MLTVLLNPHGKGRKRSAKAKRKGRSSRYKRLKCGSRISRLRRKWKLSGRAGTARTARDIVQKLVCGPGAVRRFKGLRRKCSLPPKSAPRHGGLAEIIRSRMAPGVISRNARFNYKPKKVARNDWSPHYSFNPAKIISNLPGTIKDGLFAAIPVVAGAIANQYAMKMLRPNLPAALADGKGLVTVIPNIVGAGLLGTLGSAINSKWGAGMLAGGMVQAAAKGFSEYTHSTQFMAGLGNMTYMNEAHAHAARNLDGALNGNLSEL